METIPNVIGCSVAYIGKAFQSQPRLDSRVYTGLGFG